MEKLKEKLNNVVKTIDNLEKLFENEDISVIFALEELREQTKSIMELCK